MDEVFQLHHRGSPRLVLNLIPKASRLPFYFSRTVGWFTSMHPLCLRSSSCEEAARELARVPHQGVGYGVLRYVRRHPGLGQVAPLSFNYLGQFNQDMLAVPLGRLVSPRRERLHPGELVCLVAEGRLHLHWTLPEGKAGLAEAYLEALRGLLELANAGASA